MRKSLLTQCIAVPALLVFCGLAPPATATSASKSSDSTGLESVSKAEETDSSTEKRKVRTTAYTHTESDHIAYGKKAAAGNTLRCGKVNSAAADWSRYPLGTKFKIAGSDVVYEIDDYGSALVGKDTIDLYKPTRDDMDDWGVRHVDIEVLEWGCFEHSLELLKPRAEKARHVREMVESLENLDSESEAI